MGTNYFARNKKDICKCCGHSKAEPLHIGKSSYGWTFNFRGYTESYDDKIESISDWKAYLAQNHIIIKDEYDDEISYKDFFKMIYDKQKDKNNIVHATLYPQNNWIDDEGFSFSSDWFS